MDNRKMEQELPPQGDGHDGRANDRASGGTSQNDPPKLPLNGDGLLVTILEIGGGLIAVVLGVELDAAGFHILGYFFDSIAVACGIVLIVHQIKEKTNFKHSQKLFWLLMNLNFILLVFLSFYTFFTKKEPESIASNFPPAGNPELKQLAISTAMVSTNKTQTKAVVSDDDNPATSDSIYLAGQTVAQFAEIYKGQPTELAIEASDQLAKHHPKCSIYLFEKAESYYENDPTHASSGWRQRRPDYAWSLFLAGRDGEAAGQLRKLITDIKAAITNPTSPLTATLITTTYYGNAQIDKTLDAKVKALMTNCNSRPPSLEFIGPMWNEYNLLCYQISTNKF